MVQVFRKSASPRIGLLFAMATLLGGCDDPSAHKPSESALKSVPGPKGTAALALPDQLGYVEPIVERTGAGKSAKTAFAAYFVASDGKTPLDPAPSNVEATLTLQGSESPTTVALSPRPQGNDVWGKARFATEPGEYNSDEIRGELRATIGGKAVKVPLALRN